MHFNQYFGGKNPPNGDVNLQSYTVTNHETVTTLRRIDYFYLRVILYINIAS